MRSINAGRGGRLGYGGTACGLGRDGPATRLGPSSLDRGVLASDIREISAGLASLFDCFNVAKLFSVDLYLTRRVVNR